MQLMYRLVPNEFKAKSKLTDSLLSRIQTERKIISLDDKILLKRQHSSVSNNFILSAHKVELHEPINTLL